LNGREGQEIRDREKSKEKRQELRRLVHNKRHKDRGQQTKGNRETENVKE
jgi:hypothetical protein